MRKKPLFLFLLPLFFVLHGFMENYDLVSVETAAKALFFYIVVAYLISWIASYFFKDRYKATLFAFLLLFINFSFGPLYDFFEEVLKSALLTKYALLLPATFLLIVVLALWLKKKKNLSPKISYFQNTALVVLILIDSVLLILKLNKPDPTHLVNDKIELTPSSISDKPDIYVIVADGYAGNQELNEVLHFDNSSFLQQLRDKGFHVIENSKSNYNWTIFSMASAFNMSYLKIRNPQNIAPLLNDGLQAIKHNRLFQIMKQEGYEIHDFSIFDLGKRNIKMEESVFPSNGDLLGSQTLLGHLIKVIKYNIANKLKWEKWAGRDIYSGARNNKIIYDAAWNISEQHDTIPRFIYTHMLMPHSPYYYNRNGDSYPFDQLTDGNQTNGDHYLEYLQYANKKLLDLVEHIQKESSKPPIIIVMSDHGWRRFPQDFDKKYQFINLAAIYLPDKNYASFKDSMSNVNMFRVLLNTRFGQNLPLLKDSSTYLARE